MCFLAASALVEAQGVTANCDGWFLKGPLQTELPDSTGVTIRAVALRRIYGTVYAVS